MAGSKTEQISFNPNDFTIGELEELEELVGMGIGELFNGMSGGQLTAKTIKALVYIVKRRDDPGLKLDDVKDMKVSVLLGGTDETPTVAATG